MHDPMGRVDFSIRDVLVDLLRGVQADGRKTDEVTLGTDKKNRMRDLDISSAEL